MTRKRSPQTPPTWKRVLGYTFYASVCAVAVGLGTGVGWVNRSPVLRETLLQSVTGKQADQVFESNALTLLILGCDEDRAYGGARVLRQQARSDMILVARLDFENKRVGGISIPRDLQVRIPGYRAQKINAYHAIGGMPLAEEAVESVLGIQVDRTMVLDYEAFKDMVDLIGGVEVFVPKPMKYTDERGGLHIDLDPGRHVLTGEQAIGFVRFRKTDDDFQRMQRQKDFMLAFKDKLVQNPQKLPSVTNKAEQFLGEALTSEELASLALWIRSLPSDSIKMGALPVLPGRGTNLVLDAPKVQETLINYYFTSAPSTSLRVTRR